MIIWGSTSKDKEIAPGGFYCPSCRTTTDCSHRRVSRYFTLYFIPLFATETLAEYVQCKRCGGQYDPRIASMSAQQIENLLRPWQCVGCGNHNPTNEPSCLACGVGRGAAV